RAGDVRAVLRDPLGAGRRDAAGRAEHHAEGAAVVRGPGRARGDVVEAVAVEVAGGQIPAHAGVGGAAGLDGRAVEGGRPGRGEAGLAPVQDQHGAYRRGAHREIGVAVAVEVAGRERLAEPGAAAERGRGQTVGATGEGGRGGQA